MFLRSNTTIQIQIQTKSVQNFPIDVSCQRIESRVLFYVATKKGVTVAHQVIKNPIYARSLSIFCEIRLQFFSRLGTPIVRVFPDNKAEIPIEVHVVNNLHKVADDEIVEYSMRDGGHQAIAGDLECDAAIPPASEVDRV